MRDRVDDTKFFTVDCESISGPRSFASDLGGGYGEFTPELLQILIHKTINPLKGLSINEFLKENADPSEQSEAALQSLAQLHELRHFHDCFSTSAGMMLFGSLLSELKSFRAICERLRARGETWQLPTSKWLASHSCPEDVREFILQARRRRLLRRLYMGDVEFPAEKGPPDDLWRQALLLPFHIQAPMVPLRFRSYLNASDIEQVEGVVHSKWVLLGIEGLLEGNAQAIQRTALEALWPEHVVKIIWERTTRTSVSASSSERESSEWLRRVTVLPYNVTDLFVTRYLRERYGQYEFSRSMLMKLADVALMESGVPDGGLGRIPKHPGQVFVDLLETSSSDELRQGFIRDTAILQSELESFIGRLAAVPTPSELRVAGVTDSIEVVESYVHHEISIPLLRYRIRTGHRGMWDVNEYITNFGQLPSPIVIARPDGLVFSASANDWLIAAWANFVMMVLIEDQIIRDCEVICCPKGYSMAAGLRVVEMAYHGRCQDFIDRRRCLNWHANTMRVLPRCLFSMLLNQCAIART